MVYQIISIYSIVISIKMPQKLKPFSDEF